MGLAKKGDRDVCDWRRDDLEVSGHRDSFVRDQILDNKGDFEGDASLTLLLELPQMTKEQEVCYQAWINVRSDTEVLRVLHAQAKLSWEKAQYRDRNCLVRFFFVVLRSMSAQKRQAYYELEKSVMISAERYSHACDISEDLYDPIYSRYYDQE